MGNNQGRQLSRGRSRSKILSPREWKEKGLIKRSKSQPVTSSTTTTSSSSSSSRRYTKKEDKRPIDPDEEEEEEFNDILSDEHEFATVEFYEENVTIVYNEGIKLLTKQKLLLLQIEVLRNTQDMCDVTLPVAGILLHHFNWDKDRLIEKWIENSEDVCKSSGVLLPLVPKKDDMSNIDTIFIAFKDEERRHPLLADEHSPGGIVRNGNIRLLDILRPFLVQRGKDDEDVLTLNPGFLMQGLSSSSSRNRPGSLRIPPPLPPASPIISRRNRSHHPSAENLDDMENAAVQLSIISQVQELFPELDEPFIAACLQEYHNSSEQVVHHILEGSLPPYLAERLRILRNGQVPPIPATSSSPSSADIDPSPQMEEERERDVDGAGADIANEQTYLGDEFLDSTSILTENVASEPQFHSTAGTHEDFTENPNAWFSATHTEAENESVDSMSTNTFTYNLNLSHSHVGTPTLTIRSISHLPHSEVFHTEGTEDINVENYTGDNYLTSENTSNNVFDNDSEDEEELVVRRHKTKKGGSDVCDTSEYNDMSDTEDAEGKPDGEEVHSLETTETPSDLKQENGKHDESEVKEDESWRDYVKICEPTLPSETVQITDEDVYIVPNDQSNSVHCDDDVHNNDDGTLIIEVPDEEDVEKDLKDIDLCMKDIANAFVDDACDHSACDHNDCDYSRPQNESKGVVVASGSECELVTCPVCYIDVPPSEAYLMFPFV